jgi:hypothetical protein
MSTQAQLESFKSGEASGAFDSVREEVRGIYAADDRPPGTERPILTIRQVFKIMKARYPKITDRSVCGRVTELAADGWLVIVKKEPCEESGKNASYYQMPLNAPVPEEQRTTRKRRFHEAAAVLAEVRGILGFTKEGLEAGMPEATKVKLIGMLETKIAEINKFLG